MYTDKLKQCVKVGEQRQEQYGDVADGFYKASTLAEQAFNILITPEEIALVQVALKLARNGYKYDPDNITDMINYIAIADDLKNTSRLKPGIR